MSILKKTGSLLLFLIMIGVIIWDSTYFAEKELQDKNKNLLYRSNINNKTEENILRNFTHVNFNNSENRTF